MGVASAARNVEEGVQEYLCKWRGLPYSEATWEPCSLVSSSHQEKVDWFLERNNSDCIPGKNSKVLRTRPRFQVGDVATTVITFHRNHSFAGSGDWLVCCASGIRGLITRQMCCEKVKLLRHLSAVGRGTGELSGLSHKRNEIKPTNSYRIHLRHM